MSAEAQEIEKAKGDLIFAACQHACALDLNDKKPELREHRIFTMLLGETSQALTRAAREYFRTVTR